MFWINIQADLHAHFKKKKTKKQKYIVILIPGIPNFNYQTWNLHSINERAPSLFPFWRNKHHKQNLLNVPNGEMKNLLRYIPNS